MKLIFILIALSLITVCKAHESSPPEVELEFMIKRSKLYIPGSEGHFDPKVDYEQIQKASPSLSKDKIYELFSSIELAEVEFKRIEEPPFEIVIEITKPQNIRFYFTKKKVDRKSPHSPEYHEEWDYILIGIKK